MKQVPASSGLLYDVFEQVSSEKFLDRVRRLAAPLEWAAKTEQSSRAAAEPALSAAKGRVTIRQLRSLVPRDCFGR